MFERVFAIWNFEIFRVDQSPITLGKVVIGIFLIILGYFVARAVSHLIRRRLLAKFSMEESFKYTLERLSFYITYVFVILFVLQLLSIPVTIFTLVGGALAIGIGFGSQNVMNNFISGLIVMVEQPVRIGDWVEIDNVFGQIEMIGGRSTYLRTLDNKESIIPNSYFLEKAFMNWTLSDNLVSGKLSIGVAYGTDPEKVKRVLLHVAAQHPEVLKEPNPSVMFQDFAESSLNFDLIYWVNFGPNVTPRRVASDMRFQISQIFHEENISVPFPHREVILKSQGPLSVRLHAEDK